MSERVQTYQDQTRWILSEVHQTPSLTPEELSHLLTIAVRNYEPKRSEIVGSDFLSSRELEIAKYILQTRATDEELASRFSISTGTVKFHLGNIRVKIRDRDPSVRVKTRIELFTYLHRIIM